MGKLEEIEKRIVFGNPPTLKDGIYLVSEVKRLRTAIKEISEGKGRYDLDNHQHAINTIEDMKGLALMALGEE